MNELQSLIDVGKKLRTALQETIDSCPGLPRRPIEMAKALKVNKNTTSRLCSALRSDDSVAMLGLFPGAVSLKQFLGAVSVGGADRRTIDAAHAMIDEFEAMVQAEFDDRTGLNAVVSTFVPEMAKPHELAAKQDVFRAFQTLKGISVDCSAFTCFLNPNSQDYNFVDAVGISGLYGLRRVRPGASIYQSFPMPTDSGGDPLGIDNDQPVFREFCRPSDLKVVRHDLPDETRLHLAGSAFGRSSAVDFVVANYHSRAFKRERSLGEVQAIGITKDQPIKHFVMDLLVHESLWPDKNYELRVYESIRHKLMQSNVDVDLLYVNESIEFLGRGVKRLRATKVPRYSEMIDTVMQRMGWNPDTFRCWRCQIDYPVFGSQITFVQTPYPTA